LQKPIFKNRENEKVNTTDGREVFLSRSLAVCMTVVAVDSDKKIYVLVSKRGIGTPDFQGCYNLVCGYLDYNETLEEAAKRELWEEAGLNVESLEEDRILYDFTEAPWKITSTPKGRENVTVNYGLIINIEDESKLPSLSIDNCELNEVEESIWVSEEEVFNFLPFAEEKDEVNRYWAFNHYDVYREWKEHYTTIISERFNK
jgi:8-oxo-dGTP pyrophosphatase MutT (NUDIX family)